MKHLNFNPIKAWKTGDQVTVLVSGSHQTRKDEFQRELEIAKLNLHSVEDLRYRLVGCYDGRAFTGMGTITEITGSGVEILAPTREFDRAKLGKKKVKPSGRTVG